MATEVTREGLQVARSALRRGVRKVKWETKSSPKDAFGRPYTVFLDRANLHPKGQFIREFTENLPVPDKYLSIPEGQTWLVETDFDRWYADESRAADDWVEREREARRKLYPEDWATREPTTESRRRAGPRPMPRELVALMAAGDLWCLGMQTEPTEAVLAVTGDSGELYERYVLGRRQAASASDHGMKLPKSVKTLLAKARAPRSRDGVPAMRRDYRQERMVEQRSPQGAHLDDDAIQPEE